MIVSRSADYALRALLYLTRFASSSRFVPANEISNQMHTPPFLLSRILQRLVKSGMLNSMKGHHGGFRLSTNPTEITVHDVVRVIDGPIVVHDCSAQTCDLGPNCTLRDAFTNAERAVEMALRAVTLAELTQRQAQPQQAVRANFGMPPRADRGVD